MAITVNIKDIQLRRDTEANWTSANPTLKAGEPGYETDTNRLKIGNGTDDWATLSYLTSSSSGGVSQEEVEDIVNNLLQVDSTLIKTYDDVNNLLTLALSGESFSSANKSTLDNITATQVVNLDTLASNVAVNTSKTGITVQQASDITTNNAKISFDASSSAKVVNLPADQASINSDIESRTALNDAKVSYTDSAAVSANTAKVSADGSIGTHSDVDISGIGDGQVLKWNNSNSRFEPGSDNVGAGGGGATQLSELSDVSSSSAANGNVLVGNGTDFGSRALTASDISDFDAEVSNNADVTANTAKNDYPTVDSNKVANLPADQNTINSDIESRTALNDSKNSYPSADSTKVGFITVTQAVDLDSMESDITINNSKVGITPQQSTDITTAVTHAGVTTGNPHSVSSTDIGLGNVDNTSDADKPVSSATQTALNAKQNTLVNQTNIKSINGVTLLGSGDLVVSSDDQTAIEVPFTPNGDISASNVQNAIEELDNEKVSLTNINNFSNGNLNFYVGRLGIKDSINTSLWGFITLGDGDLSIGEDSDNDLSTGVSPTAYTFSTTGAAVKTTDIITKAYGDANYAGGLTGENQRKIDNARKFIERTIVDAETSITDHIISSTNPDENKKVINVFDSVSNESVTVTSAGEVGDTLLYNNFNTGEARVIPDTGQTFTGNDTVRSFGLTFTEFTIPQNAQVSLRKRSATEWFVDGNFTIVEPVVTAIYQGGNAADPNNEINGTANTQVINDVIITSESSLTPSNGTHYLVFEKTTAASSGTAEARINLDSSNLLPNTSYTITLNAEEISGTATPNNWAVALRNDQGWTADIVSSPANLSNARELITLTGTTDSDLSGGIDIRVLGLNTTEINGELLIDNIVITQN